MNFNYKPKTVERSIKVDKGYRELGIVTNKGGMDIVRGLTERSSLSKGKLIKHETMRSIKPKINTVCGLVRFDIVDSLNPW